MLQAIVSPLKECFESLQQLASVTALSG
jgi:hypothetical protein